MLFANIERSEFSLVRFNFNFSSKVLKALGEAEDDLVTQPQMQKLWREYGFKELGDFISSKEDWEIYTRPTYIAMQEIIESKSKLAEEAQGVMNSFRTEYDAVGQHWNMVLWVAKSR